MCYPQRPASDQAVRCAPRPAREPTRGVTVNLTERRPVVANPDYRAYTVIKREGKDDFWLNLGVAFRHEDGEGFNLLLQAMPLDGKLVLRTYKEKPEEQEKVIKGKFKK